MDEWVWSNGGMIMTGENWSKGRKNLYILCLQVKNMNNEVEGWTFIQDIDSNAPRYRSPYTSSA